MPDLPLEVRGHGHVIVLASAHVIVRTDAGCQAAPKKEEKPRGDLDHPRQ